MTTSTTTTKRKAVSSTTDETLIGRRIRKHFASHGYFYGTIVAIETVKYDDLEEEMYFIEYDDDDSEDMTHDEVRRYLIPETVPFRNGARIVEYVSYDGLDGENALKPKEKTKEPNIADTLKHPNNSGTTSSLTTAPIHYPDFEALWKLAEESFLYCTAEEMEERMDFRSANKYMNPDDTIHQSSAQYGRILFAASRTVLELLQVKQTDTFLDIGHGLANVVFQAAHVIGCASRGIEVVEIRYNASKQFQRALERSQVEREKQLNVQYTSIGDIDLRCGRLEDPEHIQFMTVPAIGGAMKVFFNNYNLAFSSRSSNPRDKYYLDDYAAGLFCSMPEGSIMICCERLNLPSPRSKILRQRPKADHTGFYEYERVDLGSAHTAVSWAGGSNYHRIVGHKYTRVGPAWYVCGQCGTPTNAYQTLKGGQRVPQMCCNDHQAGLRPRKERKICENGVFYDGALLDAMLSYD